MLQLMGICKRYRMGEYVQVALDNVSLNLRDSEFVSILGPSGSGKTTLLNIIGGLDRYDIGDMVINGMSTQQYGDREWDSYRNHSIGFVFQSYNLIPHQTILANVELALTIAGVSSSERRERARQALVDVGLGEHINKRPNQLSGGQMQRVAIARALVNNPAILLADEPTGALDTETSIQVMELLRSVAQNRLVVMVTHNPELAQRYSTRIVQLRDGKIVGDSKPFWVMGNQQQSQPVRPPRVGMSFATSMSLSLQNLMTKKGRMLLTAFAGSIGIIGIALILSLSSGVSSYVSDIQRDTMVSYPITIESEALDLSSLMGSMRMDSEPSEDAKKEDEIVTASYDALESEAQALGAVTKNDLASFKEYLDDTESPIHKHVGQNGISYAYDLAFNVYSRDASGALIDTSESPESGVDGMGADYAGSGAAFLMSTSTASTSASNFSEIPMLPDGSAPNRLVTESYDIAYGEWPDSSDEVILVTQADGSIPVKLARQLGLISQSHYEEIVKGIKDHQTPDSLSWTYEQLCSIPLALVAACDTYQPTGNGLFVHVGDDSVSLTNIVDTYGMPLRIVGIVTPKGDAAGSPLRTSFAYSPALTNALITKADASAVVIAQEGSPAVSVLSGVPFGLEDDASKAAAARGYIAQLSPEEKANLFLALSYSHPEMFASMSLPEDTMTGGMTTDGGVTSSPDATAPQQPTDMAGMLDLWATTTQDDSVLVALYEQQAGTDTCESTLAKLGKVDRKNPSSISIYADSFDDKDAITKCIEDYNEATDDNSKRITYTDYVAALTGSVTSIISIISYEIGRAHV